MSLFQSLVPLLAMLALSVQDPPPAAGGAASEASDFDAPLKRIPFFQKILWTSDASFAPFEILVQKQAVPAINLGQDVALELAHDGEKIRFVHAGIAEPEQASARVARAMSS